MASKTVRVLLSAAADKPPSEFRIFRKGVNKTTKGDFIFDADAARSVMSEYRKHGVDVMIDLEHLSLDSESNNYDPSAYGWCKLELRNGELWATNVSWTTEGAARLQNKQSRYISPAFKFSEETGQVTEVYNIAICAVPATHETPALVAASKRVGGKIGTLTVEVDTVELEKIIEALGLDKDATIEDVLNAIKALQEPDADDAAAADDPKDDKKQDEEAADDGDEAAMAAKLKDLPPMLQARILAATSANKILKERVAKLEQRTADKERDALIAANAAKLPKGLEKWASKQDVETLTEYFKNAPDVAKVVAKQPQQKTKAAGGEEGGEVELTAADIRVAKLTGKTREQMLKLKKERLQKDAERKQDMHADEEEVA